MSLGLNSLLRYTGATQLIVMLDSDGVTHCAQLFDDNSRLFWYQKPGQEHFSMLSVYGEFGSRAQRLWAPTLHTKKAEADWISGIRPKAPHAG